MNSQKIIRRQPVASFRYRVLASPLSFRDEEVTRQVSNDAAAYVDYLLLRLSTATFRLLLNTVTREDLGLLSQIPLAWPNRPLADVVELEIPSILQFSTSGRMRPVAEREWSPWRLSPLEDCRFCIEMLQRTHALLADLGDQPASSARKPDVVNRTYTCLRSLEWSLVHLDFLHFEVRNHNIPALDLLQAIARAFQVSDRAYTQLRAVYDQGQAEQQFQEGAEIIWDDDGGPAAE